MTEQLDVADPREVDVEKFEALAKRARSHPNFSNQVPTNCFVQDSSWGELNVSPSCWAELCPPLKASLWRGVNPSDAEAVISFSKTLIEKHHGKQKWVGVETPSE